eukprot:gene6280-6352_t
MRNKEVIQIVSWGPQIQSAQRSPPALLGHAGSWWNFLNIHPALLLSQAWAAEVLERRPFLWLPVAAGAGALIYLNADSEPVLPFLIALFAVASGGAWLLRAAVPGLMGLALLAAVLLGFMSGQLRSIRIDAPILDHPRILKLEGIVEEVDMLPQGARAILYVEQATGVDGYAIGENIRPRHVRLKFRESAKVTAGDRIITLARLLPPARASMPGGYDFSRAAYFAGLGGVGSVLGQLEHLPQIDSVPVLDQLRYALDRSRNRLAERVSTIIGGQEGAIAAAMVTGKRMLLTEDALDLIRQAGIFHIITISGVQMTLVAGMVFWFSRRLMAFSAHLSLRYPIKKFAACIAICAALTYDCATGSRVGTERALFMTLIMLGAILADRQAFTMRNLGFAVLAVVVLEPEAIAGASFQLSFAAVAALIAVQEARYKSATGTVDAGPPDLKHRPKALSVFSRIGLVLKGMRQIFIATLCATSATAPFMAGNFHDLSPYVLIGNPLTLAIIEFFAVPGALIGALLYPLGLDSFVWAYVGAGIKIVLWAARIIGSAPGSTLHLHAFAPWALPFLALAVINMVIWRSWIFRALSIPCAIIGMLGAWVGAEFDIVIPPTGDSAAIRHVDGRLALVGRHPSAFAAQQWLSADGDGRTLAEAMSSTQICDTAGCVDRTKSGHIISVIYDGAAFEEDCQRADIIISNRQAPRDCKAKWVFDSTKLASSGSLALSVAPSNGEPQTILADLNLRTERTVLTDRPWAPRSDTSLNGRTSRLKRSKPDNAPKDTPSDDMPNIGQSIKTPPISAIRSTDDILSVTDDDLLP